MDNIKFGNNVARLRKEKNMTQKELADKLNLTDKAISKWERGLSYPDITVIENLASALDVSIEELMKDELLEDKNPKSEDINIVKLIDSTIKNSKIQEKSIKLKVFENILIILISLIVLLGISIYSSINYYALNPIRALIGYIQLELFNADYAVVQNFPTKTVYVKDGYDYMLENNYTEIKEEQMGYRHVYEDEEKVVSVVIWGPMDGYPFYIFTFESTIRLKDQKEKVEESEIKVPEIDKTDVDNKIENNSPNILLPSVYDYDMKNVTE